MLMLEGATPVRTVVVEGLDGTGKSTVTARLAEHPQCIAMLRTPPVEYADLRPIFDKLEEADRRVYYYAANYVAGDMAVDRSAATRTLICQDKSCRLREEQRIYPL